VDCARGSADDQCHPGGRCQGWGGIRRSASAMR